MKKLLLIFGTIFFTVSFAVASSLQRQVVLIRVFENQNACVGKGPDSQIFISYHDGKTQKIELIKLKDNDSFATNSIKINEALNRVIGEGYILNSSSSSMWECYFVTTFTLTKE